MGQCYYVEAKLNFKDNNPSRFCSAIRTAVEEKWGNGRIDRNLDDPFECFKFLTDENASVDSEENRYEAEFNATYSWCSVMVEIFTKAINELTKGSFVKICPDSGSILIAPTTTKTTTKIIPTKKEKGEWKKYLYDTLWSLASERPELQPRKRDSLNTLLETFLYWADEYNEGYFTERDEADTNRYCAWLVQEYNNTYGEE